MGYQFLNSLERFQDIEVVEASAVAEKFFWLLLMGEAKQLADINNEIEKLDDAKSELLLGTHSSVRSALYSLELCPLECFLGVVESKSINSILKTAKQLVENCDCKIIEILNGRGMNGQCLIYFTGESSQAAKKNLEKAKIIGQLSHFETIEPVGERLKGYFNSFGSGT